MSDRSQECLVNRGQCNMQPRNRRLCNLEPGEYHVVFPIHIAIIIMGWVMWSFCKILEWWMRRRVRLNQCLHARTCLCTRVGQGLGEWSAWRAVSCAGDDDWTMLDATVRAQRAVLKGVPTSLVLSGSWMLLSFVTTKLLCKMITKETSTLWCDVLVFLGCYDLL